MMRYDETQGGPRANEVATRTDTDESLMTIASVRIYSISE
jgi:hypothetical protein